MRLWFCCLLGLLGLSSLASAHMTLVRQGKSAYRIVIPADAIASERYAAEELQRYLAHISGATLPIVTDAQAARRYEIVLGNSTRLRRLRAKIDFAALGTDGFTLQTTGSTLIIAGGRPRGTLYGVYALLEEQLGVRWWTPDAEYVPSQPTIKLGKLRITQIPPLEYREVWWSIMIWNPLFAAKHRVNGSSYGHPDKTLPEQVGGPAVTYYPFCHSLDQLIPRALYAEHPEYFPLVNGKRIDGYVQRCLTNPEVIALAKATVRQWLQENPNANIISITQNDCHNNCQCPACKSIDDAEGTPAGSFLTFVNEIAKDIEHDYPHVSIDTFAYQYTRKAPKTLRPHPNVIIRLCSIECCFSHPLATCSSEANKAFCRDIITWQQIAPKLYVWDYTTDFAHYLLPFPNFDALQPNVQFFVEHGVKGIFEQGAYSGGPAEMEPLRAYVLAKVLWDPYTDVERHIREFIQGYYGAAAPCIQQYVDLLRHEVREKNYHMNIWASPNIPVFGAELSDLVLKVLKLNVPDPSAFATPGLNNTVLAHADRLFDEAEHKAENDVIRFRVQVARLSVMYAKLAGNRVQDAEREAMLADFLEIARQAKITHISEGKALSTWAQEMGAK
jgi:hypothetical protein